MSERIHVLAQQLFGKSSVDECDLQEIKDLVTRYPYFAPAQFLLLEKLKKENSPEYSSQLQKAVLYYHDPLEFEYFISSDRFETDVFFEEKSELPGARHQQEDEESIPVIAAPDGEIINVNTEDALTETEAENFEVQLDEVPGSIEAVNEHENSIAPGEKITEAIERVLEREV